MKKKIYYNVELRIRRINAAYPLYYSNGFIIEEDNFFEGFFTRDYFYGERNKKEIFIEMLYTNQVIKLNSLPHVEEYVEYICFTMPLRKLQSKAKYYLNCNTINSLVATLDIISTENDVKVIQEIETELKKVKKSNYI